MNTSPNFQDLTETKPAAEAENSVLPEQVANSTSAPELDAQSRADRSIDAAARRLHQAWEAPAVSASFGVTSLLTLCAVVAIGISSYLAYASLTSGKIAGCDGGWFDCESVLSSKWSSWMNIPVSVLAIGNYVGLLAALAIGNLATAPRTRYYAWFAVTALGFSAGLAALWFIGLQTFVLKHFCPWCLGAHACGLLAAATLLLARPISGKAMATAFGIAALGISVLGFGQYLNPEPETFEVIHYETIDDVGGSDEAGESDGLIESPDGLFASPDSAIEDDSNADDSGDDPFLFEAPSEDADESNDSDTNNSKADAQDETPLSQTRPSSTSLRQSRSVANGMPRGHLGAICSGGPLANWMLAFLSDDRSPVNASSAVTAGSSYSPKPIQEDERQQGDQQEEAENPEKSDQDEADDDEPEQKKRRLAAISGGSIKLDINQWPLIGSPDGEFVFVEMFDYCCPHCRHTHKTIKQAMQQMDGQLAVVVLPVPLNTKCNPAVSRTGGKFIESCDLARLAVAVWRADPEKFNQFHDWMFQDYDAPSFARALEYARNLVGKEKLDEALNNKIVDSYIKKHVEIYRRLGGGTIPKLLFPRTGIVGEYSSVQGLVDFIRREGKVLEESP